MTEAISKLYNSSNEKEQELILKLLYLNSTLSYDDLNILKNKFNNNDLTFKGDILALLTREEIEYVYEILEQIPNITNEYFLNLAIGIRRVNEGVSIKDYIANEYKNIIEKWHEENPKLDMPNGVITLSVNDNTQFVKVGNNPNVNENSLYDIASITKLYTEIILFRILKENKYNISLNTKLKDIKLLNGQKVEELYPKLNLEMTVKELISFNNIYLTDEEEQIIKKTNRKDALKALRTVYIDESNKGNYKYTDLPIMILTDLLEQMTGKEYKELLEDYITKPLGLHSTFIELSPIDQERYTGLNKNGVNDPKSNIIGGGGHAGIITDANDLIKFLSSILKPGFIFDSDMDPMLFDMLGMTKTTNKNYTISGEKIDNIDTLKEEIKEKLKKLGVPQDTIDQTISKIKTARATGVSVIGNLNIGEERFKINDRKYNSLASQLFPHKGFMVQGSTRVQGDVADFVINGEVYRTSSSILIDIHNQYDNNLLCEKEYLINIIRKSDQISEEIKKQLEKIDVTKIEKEKLTNILDAYDIKYQKYTDEYYVKDKGTMKLSDSRQMGIGYNGGYYDELSNMLSIARIMEIYKQEKELKRTSTR